MNEKTPQLRLFTALELPDEWRAALMDVERKLEHSGAGMVKWVRPELMHVTLVFLGNQLESRLSSIQAAMSRAAAGTAQFTVALGEIGSFGSPSRLRVVWAGVEAGAGGLERLHGALSSQLGTLGVPFDRKPLVPHITLARSRPRIDSAASSRLHEAMRRMDSLPRLSMRVNEFVLMESHLSPSGPEYHVIHRERLGRADV